MAKQILFKTLVLFLVPFSLFANQVQRRAALDVGSGKIKIQVADVDAEANRIISTLFVDVACVAMREDLSKSLDGRLSAEIQNKTVEAISELIKKTVPFCPEAYHGIATESLRMAKNGDELVQRIQFETGIPITIISQEEEGILGFTSATSQTEIGFEDAVSWDFGGGSFQMTAKCGDHFCVYQGKLGKVPMKHALLRLQGKDTERAFSPNPISLSEAEAAILMVRERLREFPNELREKLKEPNVAVLGIGINPVWGMQESFNYTQSDVMKAIIDRLNLDDSAIQVKDAIPEEREFLSAYVVSNLILAYGIMTELNIEQVKYVGTTGANATGALLTPKYWNEGESK